MSHLKNTLQEAMRTAVRARERDRVKALRLVNAAVKQAEIDARRPLDDNGVLAVLTRMRKQRLDSRQQFAEAGRDDLARVEQFELDVIAEFMPAALSQAEIEGAIAEAVAATGAETMKDMGRVMGRLAKELAGRADMGAVGARVKALLGSGR